MKVSIICIYYNTPREIVDCVKSIPDATKGLSYEIIIYNNNSPTPLPESVKKIGNVKVIESEKNLGYGKAINRAAKIAKGEFLLILNPDTICTQNSIKKMVDRTEKGKKIGVLGPQQIDKKGEVLNSTAGILRLPDAFFVFSPLNKLWPTNLYSKRYFGIGIDKNKEQETETVGGACMLFPKKVFDKVRGFDERFFMYFEETDICLRIKKAGYKILYYPESKIIHLVGKSTSDKKWIKKTFEESRYKFFKKYYGNPVALVSEFFLRLS